MSTLNVPNQSQNDARYATPASVSSAIASQAATDAGQYASNQKVLSGSINSLTIGGGLVVGAVNTVDVSTASYVVTLPTPTVIGQRVTVEKIDSSSNAVIISGTIKGISTTISLYWQNETVEFIAESLTSWHVTAGYKSKTSLDLAYSDPTSLPVVQKSWVIHSEVQPYNFPPRVRPVESRRLVRVINLGTTSIQVGYSTAQQGNIQYDSFISAGNWSAAVLPGQEWFDSSRRENAVYVRANTSTDTVTFGVYAETLVTA